MEKPMLRIIMVMMVDDATLLAHNRCFVLLVAGLNSLWLRQLRCEVLERGRCRPKSRRESQLNLW